MLLCEIARIQASKPESIKRLFTFPERSWTCMIWVCRMTISSEPSLILPIRIGKYRLGLAFFGLVMILSAGITCLHLPSSGKKSPWFSAQKSPSALIRIAHFPVVFSGTRQRISKKMHWTTSPVFHGVFVSNGSTLALCEPW